MSENLPMNEPFLLCENVTKSYKLTRRSAVDVLRGINLSIQRGEWVALLGASGCGKTTLLNLIGTLEHFDSGKIVCNGLDYGKMSMREAARFRNEHIGFIFQAYHLIPDLNVLDNVIIANRISPNPDAHVVERAKALLDEMGLSQRLKHHPYELSGGEQQRTAIARALINKPKFILADEPTGNLDHANGSAILDILRHYHEQTQDTTLIMITHDPEIAARAGRIVRIRDGVILENESQII